MRTINELKQSNGLDISELGKNHLRGWLKLSSKFTGYVMMGFCEEGWEHVSIAPQYQNKQPSWADMCEIKDIFWSKKEDVVQLHPRDTDYVHSISYRGQKREDIFHLWRPTAGNWNLMNEGSRPTSISELMAETLFTNTGNGLYSLKIIPEFFEQQASGKKNFEIRKNDHERNFQVNDTLILKEYDTKTDEETGRFLRRKITSVTDYEQKEGFAVLGTAPVVTMDPYGFQEMLDVKLIWQTCPYDVLWKIHMDKSDYPHLHHILFEAGDKEEQIKAQGDLLLGLQHPELIEIVK